MLTGFGERVASRRQRRDLRDVHHRRREPDVLRGPLRRRARGHRRAASSSPASWTSSTCTDGRVAGRGGRRRRRVTARCGAAEPRDRTSGDVRPDGTAITDPISSSTRTCRTATPSSAHLSMIATCPTRRTRSRSRTLSAFLALGLPTGYITAAEDLDHRSAAHCEVRGRPAASGWLTCREAAVSIIRARGSRPARVHGYLTANSSASSA